MDGGEGKILLSDDHGTSPNTKDSGLYSSSSRERESSSSSSLFDPPTYEGSGKLEGKVALITGGNSGIGKATAALFVSEGAFVIITGRRKDRGEKAVKDITLLSSKGIDKENIPMIEFVTVDHSMLEDCERVVEYVLAKYGRIDILFNNAGIVSQGTAEQTSESLWKKVMDLNVTGVWRMCRLIIPIMKQQTDGGVIVNNASDWAIVGGEDAVAYCTSKGAVVQMTKAMALDHAKHGIRINAVCPGDTFVERWEEQGFGGTITPQPVTKEQADKIYGQELPIGRVGLASEIAQAVLFLSSDASSFVTGTTLVVDGGNTAR